MSSEWQTIKFAEAPFEVIDGDRGTNYPKQHEFSSSGHCLFLNAGNVTLGGFVFSECAFITAEKDSILRKGKLARHDLVLTTRGTVGNVAYFSDEVQFSHIRINSGMVIFRPDQSRIDPYYLYLFLRSKSFSEQVDFLTSGSAQPQLPIRDMNRVEMPLPLLHDQRKICSILRAFDDRITLLRETNATLEAIAQALFKSWFVDFDPVRAKAEGRQPEGMDSATAALFPDSFEDSELGPIPKGWKVGLLQDLLVLQRGFDLPAQDRRPGKYPIIAASGPSGTHHEAMAKAPGVVTGRSGVLGRVFLELDDYWPLNTTLWVKEFKAATPCYAYEVLSLLDFKSFNAGSAVPSLNRNHVHGLKYLIPEKICVEAYEEFAIRLHKRARLNSEKAETFTQLRDTLLPRLISGQLHLPEVEEQVREAMA